MRALIQILLVGILGLSSRDATASRVREEFDAPNVTILSRNDLISLLANDANLAEYINHRVEATRAEFRRDATLADPVVSWGMARHASGNDFVDRAQHSFTASWELPLRGIRRIQTSVAERASRLEQAHAALEISELKQLVWKSWYLTQALQHHIELLERTENSLISFRDTLAKRVQLGVDPPYEVIRIDLWLDEVREEHWAMREALRNEGALLAHALGIDASAIVIAPIADLEEARVRQSFSLVHDAEVEVAQRIVDWTEEQRRLVSTQATPTLQLEGGAQIAMKGFGTAVLVGAGLRLPLSNRTKRSLVAADAQIQAAHTERRWAERKASLELERSSRSADRWFRTVVRLEEEVIPRAEAAMAAAEFAYFHEIIGFAELLDAFDQLSTFESQRVSAIYGLMEASADLERWRE